MNWLDVALIIILVIAAYSGYKTGIIRGAVLFAGLVVGIIIARRLGGSVGENLGLLGSEGSGKLLGFVVVFGVCFVGAWILGAVIRKTMHLLLLGWIDSLGGLVVGLASSAIFCTALVVALGSSSMPWATSAVQGSNVGSFLANRGSFVMGLLPNKYTDVLSYVTQVQPPTAVVSGVKLQSVSTDAAKVTGVVVISNPNKFGGTLVKRQYTLEWRDGSGTWLAVGSQSLGLIAGGGTVRTDTDSEFELPLDFKQSDGPSAAGLLAALKASQAAPVRLNGTMEINFPSEVVQATFQGEATLQVGR